MKSAPPIEIKTFSDRETLLEILSNVSMQEVNPSEEFEEISKPIYKKINAGLSVYYSILAEALFIRFKKFETFTRDGIYSFYGMKDENRDLLFEVQL